MANVIEFSIKGIDHFTKTFNEVGKSLNTVSGKVKRFETKAIGVGKAMSAGLTLPIAGIGATVLAIAGDFEKSMNRVQAISGATETEFKQLTDVAKELGSTTRFSASESAEGMAFLAQAGFEASEVIEAMPGVLDLAAAANIDLGRAADITSNILTGFGKEVGELSEVNDILVKGMTSSNTNLSQLGEAMQEVGPIANSAGQEFELTVAAIGKLSDAGIQGSKAGTALRNALVRMIDPVPDAAAAMEELGLNAVDASGRLRPLDEIVAQLEPHADNTAAMIRIFGQEAGPGMAALVGQGSESLTELADKLRNSTGEAARIAAEQSEGFNGAMVSMKSALEGLAIAIAASGFLDFATEMIEKVTGIIRVISGLPDPVIEAGAIIAATLGAGGPVLLAIGLMSKAIRGLIAAAGPIGLLITAATLLIQAWMLWGDEFKALAADVSEWIIIKFTELKERVIGIFQDIMDAPGKAWEGVKNSTSKAAESIKRETEEKFKELGKNVGDSAREMTQTVTKWWEVAADKIVGNSIVPDMVDDIGIEFNKMDNDITTTARSISGIMISSFEGIREATGQVLGDVLTGAKSFSEGMKDAFKDMVTSIVSEFAKLLANKAFRWFMGSGGKASDIFSGGAGGSGPFGSQGSGGLGGSLGAIGTVVGSFFGGFGGVIGGALGSVLGGIFHGGMDYVPREGSYLLQKGERVLSPHQNEELMNFVRNGMSGGTQGGGLTIQSASFHFFENVSDPEAMLRMTREDWREIVARKMIPAMNDLNEAGVRPVAIERKRR